MKMHLRLTSGFDRKTQTTQDWTKQKSLASTGAGVDTEEVLTEPQVFVPRCQVPISPPTRWWPTDEDRIFESVDPHGLQARGPVSLEARYSSRGLFVVSSPKKAALPQSHHRDGSPGFDLFPANELKCGG